jgi:hypothetical protein
MTVRPQVSRVLAHAALCSKKLPEQHHTVLIDDDRIVFGSGIPCSEIAYQKRHELTRARLPSSPTFLRMPKSVEIRLGLEEG